MATTRGARGGTPIPRRRSLLPPEPPVVGDAESVIEELGGGASRVVLYRREGAELAWVAELGGDSVDMPVIKKEFGPGQYQARVYKSGEDSDPKIVAFAIADTSPVKGGTDASMMTLMNRMMERIEALSRVPVKDASSDILAKVVEMVARPREADPMMTMLMTNIIPELIKANANHSSGDKEVDTLALLKLVEDARVNGMELGQRMTEAASGDGMTAVAGVIRDVGAPLAQAISERMKQEKLTQPVRAPLPAPKPAQLEIPGVINPALPEWMQLVAPFQNIIVRWAESDTDPRRQAEWLLDMLDDDLFAEMGNTLQLQTDTQIVALLESAMSGLHLYNGYVTRLVAQLRAAHAVASQDDDQVKGEGDDASV